jgi:hypothetical protein
MNALLEVLSKLPPWLVPYAARVIGYMLVGDADSARREAERGAKAQAAKMLIRAPLRKARQ